jgi:hypothetical protein
MMAASHSLYQLWCEHCILEEHLKRARERAAMIPELERQLAGAHCRELQA